MTEQEQIEQMIKIFTDNREVCHHMRCVECKYRGDEDCVYSSCAYSLYQAGYGDVSEYKAERELLGSQIKALKQHLNNKYIEVDNLNRDYHNSFERLKAQEREIVQLKDENAKLQEQFAEYQLASDKEILAQVKQAKIDVLNELKKKTHNYYPSIDSYCLSQHVVLVRDIDELLEEV